MRAPVLKYKVDSGQETILKADVHMDVLSYPHPRALDVHMHTCMHMHEDFGETAVRECMQPFSSDDPSSKLALTLELIPFLEPETFTIDRYFRALFEIIGR